MKRTSIKVGQIRNFSKKSRNHSAGNLVIKILEIKGDVVKFSYELKGSEVVSEAYRDYLFDHSLEIKQYG